MFELLQTASIVALVSLFIPLGPLIMAIVYAVRPTEQTLALMRPLSLAAIFSGLSGSTLGLLNTFRYWAVTENGAWSRVVAVGLAESLVTVFFAFGCLTAAWLCIAIGMWRRP